MSYWARGVTEGEENLDKSISLAKQDVEEFLTHLNIEYKVVYVNSIKAVIDFDDKTTYWWLWSISNCSRIEMLGAVACYLIDHNIIPQNNITP
jgi:hypothetical protein